jgi:hypothetical protein
MFRVVRDFIVYLPFVFFAGFLISAAGMYRSNPNAFIVLYARNLSRGGVACSGAHTQPRTVYSILRG